MHLPKSIKTITLAAMLGMFNPLVGCASANVEANFVESYLSTHTELVTHFNELGDTLVVVVPEGAQVKLAGWSNETANHVQRVMDIAKF